MKPGRPRQDQRGWDRLALSALLSGALLGLASLPAPTGLAVLVGLVPLLRALEQERSVVRGAFAGWLCGLMFLGIACGFFLASAGLGSLALRLAFYPFAVGLLALPIAAFGALLVAARKRDRLLFWLLAPPLWAATELARSHSAVGVPWFHLSYSLADWPALIQPAALVGAIGMSLGIAAFNAALAARVFPGRIALTTAIVLLTGWLELPTEPTRSLKIAAVQPLVDEARRHDPRHFQANLAQLVELSAASFSEDDDLVVWPESAYERDLGERGDAFLLALSGGEQAFLTGAWYRAPDGSTRNAAFLVQPGGEIVRASEKLHPVPIWERRAESPFARLLDHAGLWPGRFASGSFLGPTGLRSRSGDLDPIGVLVCMDAGYPEIARRLRREGARLLVIVTNEGSTGSWSAVLGARVARLRAVEQRVPVVRVANTGPSEWIDSRGRVVHRLAPGTAATGSAPLRLGGSPPRLAALADAPTVVAFLVSAFVLRAPALLSGRRHVPRSVA